MGLCLLAMTVAGARFGVLGGGGFGGSCHSTCDYCSFMRCDQGLLALRVCTSPCCGCFAFAKQLCLQSTTTGGHGTPPATPAVRLQDQSPRNRSYTPLPPPPIQEVPAFALQGALLRRVPVSAVIDGALLTLALRTVRAGALSACPIHLFTLLPRTHALPQITAACLALRCRNALTAHDGARGGGYCHRTLQWRCLVPVRRARPTGPTTELNRAAPAPTLPTVCKGPVRDRAAGAGPLGHPPNGAAARWVMGRTRQWAVRLGSTSRAALPGAGRYGCGVALRFGG
jgi:hypothetical protein